MAKLNRVYKHYKGNYYYTSARGKHSETEETLIAYQKLDYSKEEGFWALADEIWFRPEEMFDEEVEVEGSVVPRFEKVDKLPVPEE